MKYKVILLLTILASCNNTGDNFENLTIDDDALLTEFMQADNCKKIEIIKYFRTDILPAGEGHSEELIAEMEKITKEESSRKSTHFGFYYETVDDFEMDVKKWTETLKCKID
jgi:hypothetical protein